MSLIHVFILGIVEGLTEFLPISSTAHLIITSRFLNLGQTEFQKLFEVFIQSGAILAVIFLYWQYILKHKKILKTVLISFLPTAVIGFLLYKIIKNIFFESYLLIVISLIVLATLFLILEYLIKNKKIILNKSIANISLTTAIIIGLAQSLAVIPGISRAGIVIVIMIFMGYKREEAAIYSFLLAVPTILSASFFDLYKMKTLLFQTQNSITYLVIGFIISLITAHMAIKWFIGFIKNHSLNVFGFYRILLAIIVLLGLFS